ncbi:MAG: hypothetical protein RLZZ118_2275 [Bacteroidota bacterium]|jgi:hypothetical protein
MRILSNIKKITAIVVFGFGLVHASAQDLKTERVNPNITPYHDAADAINGFNGIRFNKASAWKNFTTQYPSWGCKFNAYTGLPHRALGNPIVYGGGDVVSIAKQFLTVALADYQIPVNELELTANKNDGKYINVNFTQNHSGYKVAFSRVTVRFTKDKKIVMFGVDAYNNIPSLTATISGNQAAQFAKNALTTPIVNATVEPALQIIPIPNNGEMSYKLAYVAHVTTNDTKEMNGDYLTYVDANTGEILYRQNKVVNIGSTIQGYILAKNNWSPKQSLALQNIEVKQGATTYTANVNGEVVLPNAGSATVTLQGLWSKVVDGANGTTAPSFSAIFNGGDTIIFDTTAASTLTTKVNAYHHVNIVHDFMKSKLPSFTTLDYQFLTRVDRTDGTCNAFYNGTSINFYDVGGGCNPTATLADVVYHEYGHGISDKYWTANGSSFDNGAMGEGYSDMWAMSILTTGVIGPGFFTNSAVTGIREYVTSTKVYPKDIVGEVHADGEIIAGAWYDTYVNWGDMDSTSTLFANSMAGLATGPDGTEGQVYHDILIDALSYDDDDANINNGTPHFVQIVSAFAKHGIYLLSDAGITHVPNANNITANASTNIDANVTVSFPAFLGDVKMYYRLKKSGTPATIDSVNLTISGSNNYTTVFPGKPDGDIYEYYFVVYDNLPNATPSAYAPVSPVFTTSLTQRNIPYYIIFGMQPLIKENFETGAPGWDITLPTDNATGGKWVVAAPLGSKTNGVLVQTDKDHTSGSGKCAVTANASTATSQPGSADVDGGRTSIQSPVFDLSGMKNPVVSYWRWFTNSQSANNPRKDIWRVYISDNGGTSYSLYADRTYQPDVDWRRQLVRLKDVKTNINLANIRFLFIAIDSAASSAAGTWVEAAVDDFEIFDMAYPAGITEMSIDADVYPNPAENIVNVDLGNMVSLVNISLIDATGKEVYHHTANQTNHVTIPTSQIANGIYFLKLQAGNQKNAYRISVKHD